MTRYDGPVEPQVVCVKVSSESTNDANERLQVLVDIVVLGYHSTSTVKDCKVEDRATNGKVDGKSHKGTSRKVKTSHVGELRGQVSQRRSICRVRSILAVTLDLQQDCDVPPERPVLSKFLSRIVHQYKVRSTLLERISFAFTVGRWLLLGGATPFRGTRCIHVVFFFVILQARALVADHDILFNILWIQRHPRNKQTFVGARNDGMDVEPDTANMSRKVGVLSGTGGRMIAIVVLHTALLFVVCVLFVTLRIVL